MFFEDDYLVVAAFKKHKQHNMSWEQQAKSVRDKKVQERLKALRKAGREAKRNNGN